MTPKIGKAEQRILDQLEEQGGTARWCEIIWSHVQKRKTGSYDKLTVRRRLLKMAAKKLIWIENINHFECRVHLGEFPRRRGL